MRSGHRKRPGSPCWAREFRPPRRWNCWPERTPPTAVVVGGRDPDRAEALAARHPHATADSVEVAVRGSDVVLCCTGAREPVLRRT